MTLTAKYAGTVEEARRNHVAGLRYYADDLEVLARQARHAAILAEACTVQSVRLTYAIGVLAARMEVLRSLAERFPLIYDTAADDTWKAPE